MPKEMTHLSLVQELRTDDAEEGILEGYAAVWNSVDSYNSRFQRGCFKKTLENRTHKIKLLWNHNKEQPIGKLLEIREDDHGLFVRAQLLLDIEQARNTYTLAKNAAIDCFSFGFRTIKDKFENGVQVITEVMLGEISPVVFEANPSSKITDVRSDNFMDTDEQLELSRRGYRLMESLERTLDDIWWGDSTDEEKVGLIQTATSEFASSYSQWAQEIIDMRTNGMRMDVDGGNLLTQEFRRYCSSHKKSIEDIAQETSFNIEELRSLKAGKPIADHDRLTQLSDDLFDAHNAVRSKAVETLCDELRAGINSAEATRINSLLQKSLHNEVESVVTFMSEFREKLNAKT